MNENAERINGWAANDWCHCRNGIICYNRTTDSRYLVMGFLAVAGIMILAFGAGAMVSQSGDET